MSTTAADYRLDWILHEGDTIQTADATYTITGEPIGLGGSSVLYPASKSGSYLEYAIKECFPAKPAVYQRINGIIQTANPDDELNQAQIEQYREMLFHERKLGQEIRNATTRAVSVWDELIPMSITNDGEVFQEVSGGIFSVLERMDKKGRFFNELLADIRNACPPEDRRTTFGLPSIQMTVQIMEQVLLALQQVHIAGYYYGDLNGANVFFSECEPEQNHVGNGHLIDFGSTRKLESDGFTAPIIDEPVFSTDGFRPFEIRDHEDGTLRLSKQADIYSAGCLFLRCVLSLAKIRTLGDSPSVGNNALNEVNGKAIGCTERALQLVNEILDKATKYDPIDRYADASEMLDAILELKKYTEPPKFLLPSNLSSPDYWVPHSRDKILSVLTKSVKENKKVFLHGVGGIGKSETARVLAKQLQPPRGAFLIHYRNSMRETIMHMNFSGYRFRPSQNTSEDMLDEMEYQDRLRILKDHYHGTVLVIDNFNVENKSLEDLQEETAYQDIVELSDISFIFTTRYEVIEHPEWEIKALEDSAALQILKQYCPQTSDILLKRIVSAVHGHTLTLTLIGKSIRESQGRMTAVRILDALENNTLSQINSPAISSDKDRKYKQADIYAHLKILFNLSSLSEMQKSAMTFAAFLSGDGLPNKRLLHVLWEQTRPSSFDSYEENEQHQEKCSDAFCSLIKYGWLKTSPEDIITVHPVIQELVIGELKPSLSNCERGLKGLHRVQFRSGTMGKVFPDSFQLASFFSRAGRILNVERYMDYGEEIRAELAKQDAILAPHIKALAITQRKADIANSELAERYEQIGLTHISLDAHGKQAVDCCLEALRLRENDPNTTKEQLAWSLFYVGLAYQRHHGDPGYWRTDVSDSLLLADDYHRRALSIWNELPPSGVEFFNMASAHDQKTNLQFTTAYRQMLSDYGYRHFPGTHDHDKEVLYWLQIEAALENVTAMLSLARRYRDGIGCIKDIKQSYYWASMAVAVQTKHDNLMLLNSGHTEIDHYFKDCVTHYGYYEKPLINGARVFFATQIINDVFYSPSEEEKTYWIWYAAEAGDLRYMLRYAMCLISGTGCREDQGVAFEWLCRIAKTIGTNKSNELTYHHDDSWPRELEDVKKENNQILEKAHQVVLHNFGETHIQKWYHCAVTAGNLGYVDNLGKKLLKSACCVEDYGKAFLLLQELSQKGSVMADYYLGWMYLNGYAEGNIQDVDKALTYFNGIFFDSEAARLILAEIHFGLNNKTNDMYLDPGQALFCCDFTANARQMESNTCVNYETEDILQLIDAWVSKNPQEGWDSSIYLTLSDFYYQHAFDTRSAIADEYKVKGEALKEAEPEEPKEVSAQPENEIDPEICSLIESIIRELDEAVDSL